MQSRVVAAILAERGIPTDKTNTYLTRYKFNIFRYTQVYWLFIEHFFDSIFVVKNIVSKSWLNLRMRGQAQSHKVHSILKKHILVVPRYRN